LHCVPIFPRGAPEEVLITAKEPYNLDESDKIELELRYTKYGRVARSNKRVFKDSDK